LLSFQLFGSPQMFRDGVSLYGKASQKRRLALLAFLAGAPSRSASRERLIGVLWPVRDAAQARKLLSESLYVIRKEFGDELFEASTGDVVTLSADALSCDYWDFQAAIERGDFATAASLSEAPLLDGVFLDEAEEFEKWLDGARSRVARDREKALTHIAAEAEAAGRWLDASHAWLRLLHDEPLSSRFVLAAAGMLVKAGEVPAALQALTSFEDRLRREMDVAPEPEVIALMRQLRADRPAAEVRVVTPTSSSSLREPLVLPDATRRESSTRPEPRGARPGWWRWAATALLVVVLGAAGAWWRSAATPTSPRFAPQRLAVLYFRDGSAEQDLAPIADLITESVIEQLAGSPAFEVIPVSGVRPFRDAAVGLDSIVQRLRVGSVIEGSLHRSADERIVVRVRVIDSESDAVVFSSAIERSANDLFALEEEVARELAQGIRQRLGRDVRLTQLQRGSNNVRAWRLVARGAREREDAMRLASQRAPGDSVAAFRGLRRADSLFEQARVEDRDWTRPVIERAWTAYAYSTLLEGERRVALLDTAIGAVSALMEGQRPEAAALEVRGALRWARLKSLPPPLDASELTSVVQELEEAVELDSTLARAWGTLSNVHLLRGEVERAEFAGRRALEVDAYIEDAPMIYRSLVSTSIYRGVVDSARAWCARGQRYDPRDWWFTECELTIMKYDRAGRPDPERAWRLVARLDSLDPPPLAASAGHRYSPVYRRLVAATVSARAGDLARARAELDQQRIRSASDSSLLLDMVPDEISLLLEFGERDAALDRLLWAIERRPLLRGVVANDPILQTFAADVRPSDRSTRATPVPIPR
jgi:DNA-binding SARP family transcriptional activator/TolB-like protein